VSKFQEMYKQKLSTAEEIVKQVKSGDICACPSALGEPAALVEALAERALKEDLSGITHHMLLACRKWKYLQPELAGKMTHVAWFTSGGARPAVNEGRADYMPNFYHEVPRYWREYIAADVFYAMVSPMDKHGYFSFGVAASEGRGQMSRAKKIFLEVNEYMPRIHGDNFVHISEVDAICEANIPLPELPDAPLAEKDILMGNYIAEQIPDGACIQLGIGGVPNAVGKALMNKKDLGLHSEMFTDSMVSLIEAGVVTNRKKNINKLKTIASFAFGSRKMYDYLDDNPGVEFYPVSYVNEPTIIGQNDNVISINACLEVDFLGQVCSESIGPKNFSGTGGQLDFVRGANRSKGGKAFIAMYSTAKNDTISKITPMLTQGAAVTTTKNDVDCIVTEYGIAKLKGKTAGQRAKELINIAHPKFREELLFTAKKMNLLV